MTAYASINGFKTPEGTIVPALRRAQPIVTRILQRLASLPAPPDPPPDATTAV